MSSNLFTLERKFLHNWETNLKHPRWINSTGWRNKYVILILEWSIPSRLSWVDTQTTQPLTSFPATYLICHPAFSWPSFIQLFTITVSHLSASEGPVYSTESRRGHQKHKWGGWSSTSGPVYGYVSSWFEGLRREIQIWTQAQWVDIIGSWPKLTNLHNHNLEENQPDKKHWSTRTERGKRWREQEK